MEAVRRRRDGSRDGPALAAARLHVNFFQPSFKLKEKRREGAKVIKRYHEPSTPYERALAHPMVAEAVKERLRAQYRTLDPVALLAEIRAAQEELGNRIDRPEASRGTGGKSDMVVHGSTAEPAHSPEGSAMISRAANRVRRIGDPSAITRNGSGCRQSSIRTWR
jgi:hypothetical protein